MTRLATLELPTEHGFRMPPEWAPHAATWTSWPFDDELWVGHLEEAREDMARLVATIARFEPVVLNVRDGEAERDARARLARHGVDPDEITYHRLALDDIWFRDNGPIFVTDANGCVALTDWRFNAWGDKYAWEHDTVAPAAVAQTLGMRRFELPYVMEGGALEMNGEGVLLTTRQCLLEPHRNPTLSEPELEDLLKEALGAKHVVWLERGLEGDHTDGHIDTIVRFADDRTIVASVSEDPADKNYRPTRHNLEALRALRDGRGEPYRIVELPLPRQRRELEGNRLPLTYANWYLGNGFVIVPTYGDENDERALDILRPLFEGREVIGLPASGLITGGGAFHCVTQQQPAGEVLHD